MSNRTSLVTGGTEGIGRAVALELARKGHRVLIAGRHRERGAQVALELARIADRDHRFVGADLSLLASTAQLADDVERAAPQLDAIVCCAGILSTIPEVTAEGFDRTFALGFLSRYLLARQLLPLLERSPSGRLVLVANAGMYKDTLDLDDISHRHAKPGLDVSGRSQFANDLFTMTLAARLRERDSSVGVACVFPGMVKTRVFANARGLPWLFRLAAPLLRLFQITPARAAETPAYLAHDEHAVVNGRFFGPRCRERAIPSRALDLSRGELLLARCEAAIAPFVAETSQDREHLAPPL